MRVKFTSWSPEELVNAYLHFVRKRHAKDVNLSYTARGFGFHETMNGHLDINDPRVRDLPKKIQFSDMRQDLKLWQFWKDEFELDLSWDPENEHYDQAFLKFDSTLRKQVYNNFKQFKPQKV